VKAAAGERRGADDLRASLPDAAPSTFFRLKDCQARGILRHPMGVLSCPFTIAVAKLGRTRRLRPEWLAGAFALTSCGLFWPVDDYDSLAIGGDSLDGGSSRFELTPDTHSETEDLDAVCKQRLGQSFRLADWDDIVRSYENDPDAFVEAVQLPSGASAMVQFGGQRFIDKERQFYIQRNDHVKPPNFLSYANLGDHLIDLGSWYGLNSSALCVRP
jgi:hypothetical protein